MHIRPGLAVVSLVLSMTLGCSGDEAMVSTSDTTSPTDITSTTSATTASTSEPATAATTTAPTPSSTTTQPTATSTSTTSSAPATTTSLPQPTPAGEPVELLVVDVDGAWLWSSEGQRQLVIDGAVGSAIPDRVGGIVYQNVETGAWRANQYDAPPNTAQWKWIGTGSAQPIRRVLRPGGTGEIVVEAPPDGALQLLDTAIVDGHPTLAYVRTRHFTITIIDENPWWDSRTAELVVHDLTTGAERVVRTQFTGWEYDGLTWSLGEGLVAEAVAPYGDGGNWIELLGFDGTSVDMIDELADCEYSCSLVADLGPTGAQLVYTQQRPWVSGQTANDFAMTVVDHRSGSEQMRTEFSLPEGTTVISLDTVDGRTLAVTGSWTSQDAVTTPVLRRGDRGQWVVVLQQLLSGSDWQGDTYLTPDGAFGPRTEAAVRAFQTGAGLDADGIVGTATWSQLIAASGSIAQLHDPVLIEADGSSRRLPVPTSDVMPDRHSGPTITLWSQQ